jgi:type IV secretory pathway TrbL component
MAWHSTTDTWSGGDEALEHTAVMRAPRAARRKRSWPAWVLPTLAFVCGALVSAAVFTIGWRHQTQQNAAAESALARETARSHRLSASLAAARATIARDQQVAGQARAALQSAHGSAATIAAQASAAQTGAASVSGSATAMASTAAKIATELRTLTAYLTTTPPQQLDAGYIDSQTAYLARQVDALQSTGGTVTSAAANFDEAIRKLGRLASALAAQK